MISKYVKMVPRRDFGRKITPVCKQTGEHSPHTTEYNAYYSVHTQVIAIKTYVVVRLLDYICRCFVVVVSY